MKNETAALSPSGHNFEKSIERESIGNVIKSYSSYHQGLNSFNYSS